MGDAAPSGIIAANPPPSGNHRLQWLEQYRPAKLSPRNFSIKGLPDPSSASEFPAFPPDIMIESTEDAATTLCAAAFQRDIFNLKHLLYDVGVSASSVARQRAGKTALHCLAHSFVNTEISSLHTKVYHRNTWVHDRFERNFLRKQESGQFSVLMRTLFEGEEINVVNSARWLLRAGTPINAKDDDGNTALILASMGDLPELVKLLLENGAEVNAVNKDGRNAMHFAAVYGHYQVAEVGRTCSLVLCVLSLFSENTVYSISVV
jgi:hypothetical protein